jgi:hypothetical protein
MKALLKLAFATGLTYALLKAILAMERTARAGAQATDAANPPASVDDIPTLRASDAQAPRSGSLDDEVAPGAPF